MLPRPLLEPATGLIRRLLGGDRHRQLEQLLLDLPACFEGDLPRTLGDLGARPLLEVESHLDSERGGVQQGGQGVGLEQGRLQRRDRGDPPLLGQHAVVGLGGLVEHPVGRVLDDA